MNDTWQPRPIRYIVDDPHTHHERGDVICPEMRGVTEGILSRGVDKAAFNALG